MKKFLLNLAVVLIAVQLIYVAVGVIANPFATGDGYAIWFLKAKALLQSHSLDTLAGFLQDPAYQTSHPEYPLLLPAFLALLGPDWRLYLWLYPLVFLLVVVLAYLLVAAQTNRFWGLLAAFSVSSVMVLERLGGRGEVGFADLPLGLFYLLGFSLFWRKKINYLLLGLVWGLAANLKLEGLLGAGLFAVIFRPKKNFWLVFLPLVLWWPLVNQVLGLKTIYQHPFSLAEVVSRFGPLLSQVIKSLLDFGRFGLWPVLAILIWPSFRGTVRQSGRWLTVYLELVALSYLVSPLELVGHWQTSFYRILAQVLPLGICLIFIQLGTRNEVLPVLAPFPSLWHRKGRPHRQKTAS